MEVTKVLALLLSATLFAVSQANHEDAAVPMSIIHPLRPQAAVGHHRALGMSCESWRLAVETNNIQNWVTVPLSCESYVGHYMLGDLYLRDSRFVSEVAAKYAVGLNLTSDSKDVWVFDIDETTLSNLPYYAKHGFGSTPYNSTAFNQWVYTGKAPALPESLKLYKKLLALGIKIIFLTGRGESQREITTKNLKMAGYHTWEKLLLKGANESSKAVVYKSGQRMKLVAEGFRIVGNCGDQWSDILGPNKGSRTFKMPDPMYYIA